MNHEEVVTRKFFHSNGNIILQATKPGAGHNRALDTETYLMYNVKYSTRVFADLAVLPTPVLEREGDEALKEWPVGFREFRWRVYQNYSKGKKIKTMGGISDDRE